MSNKEKTVQEQVTEIATALNLSARCKGVAETARYMGVDRVSLSKTLRCCTHMKLSTAVKIADALNMELVLRERNAGQGQG